MHSSDRFHADEKLWCFSQTSHSETVETHLCKLLENVANSDALPLEVPPVVLGFNHEASSCKKLAYGMSEMSESLNHFGLGPNL